MIEILFIL